MASHTKRDPHYPEVGLWWNGAPRQTIKMVAVHPLVPLNPNINVGENERLSFYTISSCRWSLGRNGLTWLYLILDGNDVGGLKTEVALLKNDVGMIRFDMGSFRDEFQLFRGEMEIRTDRIEGMTNQSRAEMLNLRADFREFKTQIKESAT